MGSSRGGGWLVVFLMCLSGCFGNGPSSEGDPLEVEEARAIVNGTTLSAAAVEQVGLVAVYHPVLPSFTFYPRPCSGTIIVSKANFGGPGYSTSVLTARHCVTTDGTTEGPLASAGQIRLMPGANPGIANPNPPAGAVTPFSIVSYPGDVALIHLGSSTNWTTIANNRLGLYVGLPASLVGRTFTAYGYGINVNDQNCHDDNSTVGAGTARQGGPFPITEAFLWISGQPASYFYTNLANGQSTICGDSGGPDQMLLGSSGMRHVIGVHAAGIGSSAASDLIDVSLQQHLQFKMSVARIGSGPLAERKNIGAQANKQLNFVLAGNVYQSNVAYNVATRRLMFTNPDGCLSLTDGLQMPPSIVPCDLSDARQSWAFDATLLIRHDQMNRCLTALAVNSVAMGVCSATNTNQQWMLHPQP